MSKILSFTLLAILMALAGLWQLAVPIFDPPEWIKSENALKLRGNSLLISLHEISHAASSENVTLDINLKFEEQQKPYLDIVFELYNTHNQERFILGQWKNTLMLLNSNDFENHNRSVKIYSPIDHLESEHNIQIIANRQATRLFINSIASGSSTELTPPSLTKDSLLILTVGNGIEGANPWSGTLYSFILQYGNQRFAYGFAEKPRNTEEMKPTSNGSHLFWSSNNDYLKSNVLTLPDPISFSKAWMWKDILLNFVGFIPFGFVLFQLLPILGSNQAKTNILICCICSFLFSLSIELIQTTLPDRTSSLLDLSLNTLGGFIGALGGFKRERSSQLL